MFFVLLLLLAPPISISSKSLDLYKHYELPTGANPLVGEHHSHDFAFFQRAAHLSTYFTVKQKNFDKVAKTLLEVSPTTLVSVAM